MMTTRQPCLAVLRLRGRVNISRELEDIFRFMHLPRKYHVTLLWDTPSNTGSLHRVKDYVTWGEASLATITQLLQQRGYLTGHRRLTEEAVRKGLGYESIAALAQALHGVQVDLWKLPGLKPVFRLHPPRGGFQGTIKMPYPKGEVGYRGDKINDLIAKML